MGREQGYKANSIIMKKTYIIPEVASAPIKMGHLMDVSVAGPIDQSQLLAPRRKTEVF